MPLRKHRLGQLLTILILIMLTTTNAVFAKQKSVKPDAGNRLPTLMVAPKLPKDNLSGQHAGYFDLQLKKDKARSIAITVYNPTLKAVELELKAYAATTLDNASINYTGQQKTDTNLLKNPGLQYLDYPETITVPAGTQIEVPIKIKAQSKLFTGTKAIGFNLIAKTTDKKQTMTNQYDYGIAILLKGQKLQKTAYQKLKTNGITLQKGKTNNQIAMSLINQDALLLAPVDLDLKLTNANWGFINYQAKRTKRGIAPKTAFENAITFEKKVVDGAYDLTLKVKSQAYQQAIHKYVKIQNGKISYIQKNEYLMIKYRTFAIASGILVMILIIGSVVYRKKRGKRHDQKISE